MSNGTGWNRSSEGTAAVKPSAKSPSLMKGVIVGAVAVVVGVVCIFMFSGKSEKPVEKAEKSDGLIKEVTPAAAPKYEEPETAEKEKPVEKKKDWWETDNTNGFTAVQQRVWWARRTKPTYVARLDRRRKAWWNVFEHRSENMIAGLLAMKPGQMIIGTLDYDGVDEDFRESCKTPIIPTKDDSPEIAELKRTMNKIKIEIKDRLDAGEKLADILQETHKEMFRLGQVKNELAAMVEEQVGEGTTKQDVEDLVAAANKMLEDKGVAPISAGPIIRNKLLMHDYVAPDEKAEDEAEAANLQE